MKKLLMLLLPVIMLSTISSCKKDEDKKTDARDEYVGTYSVSGDCGTPSSYTSAIEKHPNDESKLYFTFKRGAVNHKVTANIAFGTFAILIPSQTTNNLTIEGEAVQNTFTGAFEVTITETDDQGNFQNCFTTWTKQ
jgi:hypothetical protein